MASMNDHDDEYPLYHDWADNYFSDLTKIERIAMEDIAFIKMMKDSNLPSLKQFLEARGSLYEHDCIFSDHNYVNDDSFAFYPKSKKIFVVNCIRIYASYRTALSEWISANSTSLDEILYIYISKKYIETHDEAIVPIIGEDSNRNRKHQLDLKYKNSKKTRLAYTTTAEYEWEAVTLVWSKYKGIAWDAQLVYHMCEVFGHLEIDLKSEIPHIQKGVRDLARLKTEDMPQDFLNKMFVKIQSLIYEPEPSEFPSQQLRHIMGGAISNLIRLSYDPKNFRRLMTRNKSTADWHPPLFYAAALNIPVMVQTLCNMIRMYPDCPILLSFSEDAQARAMDVQNVHRVSPLRVSGLVWGGFDSFIKYMEQFVNLCMTTLADWSSLRTGICPDVVIGPILLRNKQLVNLFEILSKNEHQWLYFQVILRYIAIRRGDLHWLDGLVDDIMVSMYDVYNEYNAARVYLLSRPSLTMFPDIFLCMKKLCRIPTGKDGLMYTNMPVLESLLLATQQASKYFTDCTVPLISLHKKMESKSMSDEQEFNFDSHEVDVNDSGSYLSLHDLSNRPCSSDHYENSDEDDLKTMQVEDTVMARATERVLVRNLVQTRQKNFVPNDDMESYVKSDVIHIKQHQRHRPDENVDEAANLVSASQLGGEDDYIGSVPFEYYRGGTLLDGNLIECPISLLRQCSLVPTLIKCLAVPSQAPSLIQACLYPINSESNSTRIKICDLLVLACVPHCYETSTKQLLRDIWKVLGKSADVWIGGIEHDDLEEDEEYFGIETSPKEKLFSDEPYHWRAPKDDIERKETIDAMFWDGSWVENETPADTALSLHQGASSSRLGGYDGTSTICTRLDHRVDDNILATGYRPIPTTTDVPRILKRSIRGKKVKSVFKKNIGIYMSESGISRMDIYDVSLAMARAASKGSDVDPKSIERCIFDEGSNMRILRGPAVLVVFCHIECSILKHDCWGPCNGYGGPFDHRDTSKSENFSTTEKSQFLSLKLGSWIVRQVIKSPLQLGPWAVAIFYRQLLCSMEKGIYLRYLNVILWFISIGIVAPVLDVLQDLATSTAISRNVNISKYILEYLVLNYINNLNVNPRIYYVLLQVIWLHLKLFVSSNHRLEVIEVSLMRRLVSWSDSFHEKVKVGSPYIYTRDDVYSLTDSDIKEKTTEIIMDIGSKSQTKINETK